MALLVSSCGDSDGSSAGPPPNLPVTVRTSPALAPLVEALAAAYKTDNEGATINVVTQAPGPLVTTVKTVKAGLAVLPDALLPTGSQTLDSGSLGRTLAVIAVAEGNPKKIAGPPAFANKGLRTVVCGTGTPNLTALVLAKANTKVARYTGGATCGADAVKKIASGDLDAVLMFRNDVSLPDEVALIDIPDSKNVVIKVSWVALSSSAQDRAFGEFLASDEAKDILSERGYLP